MKKILVTLYILLACTSLSYQSRADELDGLWTSPCFPIGKQGRHGYIVESYIDKININAVATIYETNNCQIETVEINYTGEIHKEKDGAHNRFNITHVLRNITFSLKKNDVVDYYNKSKGNEGCGVSGWKLSTPVSVLGRTCGSFKFGKNGAIYKDTITINDNSLEFAEFPHLIFSTENSTKVHQASAIFRRASKASSGQ